MKKITITFFCIHFFAFTLYSQQSCTLSGKIADQLSLPVKYCSIAILNTDRGTFSDENGYFSFKNLAAGKYTLQVSAIGFASLQQEVICTTSANDIINIHLKDAAIQLDAILVSAQKREELLQQVPVSITALSSGRVQQLRLWNNSQLSAVVPNLYSSNPGDGRDVTSIRGITTTSYDPAVATYIDGVNQFGLDTYIPQLFDVERIEILRGPQGTLYGRNAMGGVINIITKQPASKQQVFAEISAGNYNQQRYVAGFRSPLVKNKLFIGVSGLYDTRTGFYTNDFNNQPFDKQHSFTGNYFIKLVASSKWSFHLNVKHNNAVNNGAFPLVNGAADAINNPYRLNQDATAKMIDNTLNSSISINYNSSHFIFSSQTAYQSNHRYYNKPLDGDFSPIDGVTVINNYGDGWNKVKVFTQELKFSSPASSEKKLQWTAGSWLFHQNNPAKQAIHFGKDAALLGAPDSNFSTISSTKGRSTGMALFAQGTYAVTDKLNIIAGMRYDLEKKKYNVLGEYQKDPDPNPLFETRPDTSASKNFSSFSPKLGIAYKINAGSIVFAMYSRGYRTGGFTQLSSDPSQPPLFAYQPEYSNNIEVGVKNTLFHNRVQFNAAVFYSTITDVQVPTLVLPDAITVTKNAGKLNSKGFEMELSAIAVKGLDVDYNFGYTKAVYKNLKLAQYGNVTNLDGKKQIFTPDVTSMLAVQYSYLLSKKLALKLTARGEWKYAGKQYFDLSNSISQGSYNVFNSQAGISFKQLSCMIWARNLGGKKYIAYAYDFGAVHLGDPKTYGITLSLRL